jgi:ATP/maltotriose-dependent transcriptional regulator MalT
MAAATGAPRTSRYLISRPRLIERLNDALDHRLFVVVAPAGYGKTSLAAEFVNHVGVPAVWLGLEPHHADPAVLCAALVEALRSKRKRFGQRVDASGSNAPGLVAMFIEGLRRLREPLVIVLDDFHVVDAVEPAGYSVQDFVWALATHPDLEHVHLVLLSRTAPAIRSSKLKLEGQMDGFDQEELEFTTEEVRAYLEATRGASVSLSEAESCRVLTGGWIAGLVLAEAAGPKSTAKAPRPADSLAQYLDEEVMPTLPLELRQFAVEAAALTEMSQELCNYALNRHDSAQLLRKLESRNLFLQRLPGDDELHFRFHALFRDYLASKLASDRRRAIEQKAGQYYATRGDWLRAVTYTRNAEAWDGLRQILLERGRWLIGAGHFAVVRQLLTDLSQHADVDEALLLIYAEALVLASEPELAEQALRRLNEEAGSDPGQVAMLRARIARVTGKNEEAIRIAEQQLASGKFTIEQEPMLHRVAGVAHTFLGRYEEAEAHHKQALKRFQALGNLVDAAYSKSDLGLIADRQARFGLAEEYHREALRTFRKHGRTDHLPMALNNLASVLVESGRQTEALDLLLEARTIVEHTGDLYWRAYVNQSLGETYRALGRLDAAAEAFQASAAAAWDAGATQPEQLSNLWLAMVNAERGERRAAGAILANLREQPACSALVTILDDLVNLRLAWLDGERGGMRALAERLLLRSQELRQPRFLSFARLFLLASLASEADAAVVQRIIGDFVSDAAGAEDAVQYFPDVFEAARQALARHRLQLAEDAAQAWSKLAAHASRQQFATVGPAETKRYPASLEVLALQPALRILIDGKPYTGGWYGALDLFLYLVHHPEGDVASKIALDLWGESDASDRALQQRFQSKVAFLRRILGPGAIVREGSARPGHYRLNPAITLTYDVRQLLDLAMVVLDRSSGTPQLPAVRSVRLLRAAPYWGGRHLSGEWASDILREVEGTVYALLTTEIELARAQQLPIVRELERLRDEVTQETGIGLRTALTP